MINAVYLVSAILFAFAAHLIRVARWQLFIEIYEKPQKSSLMRALSAGYVLNYFLPYKLGDVVRAVLSGRKMFSGLSLGFSSVIVERYLDIVTVGLIFICLSIVTGMEVWDSVRFYASAAVLLLFFSLAAYAARGKLKKGIKKFAEIFNERIELGILKFAWTLIWNFKDIFQKIGRLRLIVYTIAMWCCYLLSYSFVGLTFRSGPNGTYSWIDVFLMLFTQSGLQSSTYRVLFPDAGGGGDFLSWLLRAYIFAPLLLLAVFSFLPSGKKPPKVERQRLNLLPHLNKTERRQFLELYFSNQKHDFIMNYLEINQNISIIRDYSAGSNAATMLCTDGSAMFFRKYAFSADGDKLYEQVQWLRAYSGLLPLSRVKDCKKTAAYCYYDMEYVNGAVSFFEYMHSAPVEKSWDVIVGVLESLEKSVYQIDAAKADPATLHAYIEAKVSANLRKIRAAALFRELSQYDAVFINGVQYPNLRYYEPFLREECLLRIFRDDPCSVIHGDLTVENIICTDILEERAKFYLIDPNTGNIHNSASMDLGKILQSIHGRYEFFTLVRDVSVSENRINFLFTDSSVYAELHRRLRDYVRRTFGEKMVRSMYFHEIIHWIRLMPYKIEKDEKRAFLYYAGMLMVMDEVIKMYAADAEVLHDDR